MFASAGLCLQVKLQRCLPFKHKVSSTTSAGAFRVHGALQSKARTHLLTQLMGLPVLKDNSSLPVLPPVFFLVSPQLEIYISEGTHSTEEDSECSDVPSLSNRLAALCVAKATEL